MYLFPILLPLTMPSLTLTDPTHTTTMPMPTHHNHTTTNGGIPMKHNDTITVAGYAFARHTIDNNVYYESPLTGELIHMTKPYTL